MEVVSGAFHNILRPLLMTRDKREVRTGGGRRQEDNRLFIHNRQIPGDGFRAFVEKTHGHGKVSRLSTGDPQEGVILRLSMALISWRESSFPGFS